MNTQTIISPDRPIIKDDLMNGLTEGEVLQLQKKFGFNKIESENHLSLFQILLGQFKSPSAAGLSAVTTSHFLFHKEENRNPELCNNILFFTLICSQLLHVLNMNSKGTSIFKSEIARNKYVWYSILVCVAILIGCYEITPARQALSLFPLTIFDWAIIIAFSFAGLIINQLAKVFNVIKQ